MPKTLGGVVGYVVSSVIMVTVAMFVINRIPPLASFVYGVTGSKKAA